MLFIFLTISCRRSRRSPPFRAWHKYTGAGPRPGDPRPGDPRPGDPRPGDPRPKLLERSPRGESPRGKSPRGKSPRGRSPRGKSPGGKSPRGRNPRGRSPEGKSPGSGSPIGENPKGEGLEKRGKAWVPQINIRIRFPSSAKRRLHPGIVFREEFVFSSEAGSRSEEKSDAVGFLFRCLRNKQRSHSLAAPSPFPRAPFFNVVVYVHDTPCAKNTVYFAGPKTPPRRPQH